MRRCALLALTVLLLAGTAGAQMSPIKLYAGLGMGLPQAPAVFDDNFKTGFGAMAGVGLGLIPKLEAVPTLEYYSFDNDIDQFGVGKMKIVMFGVNGKLNLGIPTVPMKPYLLAGGGMARFTMGNVTVPQNASDAMKGLADAVSFEDQTKFFYNIGGGLEWKFLIAVSIFAQGRYVHLATDGDPTRFWALNVGVKLL